MSQCSSSFSRSILSFGLILLWGIFLVFPIAAQSVSRLTLEESTDLIEWQEVEITPEMLDGNGKIIVPSDTAQRFFRMQVEMVTPVEISTQPASVSISIEDTATLSVEVTGTGPFTFEWFQGEVGETDIPVGDNTPYFTTPSLIETTNYWVKVTNGANSVDSEVSTVTVTGNAILVEMSKIQGGIYFVGRTGSDTDTNAPSTQIRLSSFYIGKYEVSKAIWDEVRSWGLDHGYNDLSVGDGKAGNHPVQSVHWWDVIKWCNARSEKEGLTPCYSVGGFPMKTGATSPVVDWSANGYRLPTEAEWEIAARGGIQGKRYPWGADTISHSDANYLSDGSSYGNQSGNVGFHPSYMVGSPAYTSPVGSFAANGYGLFDMAGNVGEWCWDLYAYDSYVMLVNNPRGATSGSSRVFRGGGWNASAILNRVASRYYSQSSQLNQGLGFRLVRSKASQVLEPSSIIVNPVSTTLMSGNSASLMVVAMGSPPLTYEWFEGNVGDVTMPVGSNSPSFTTPSLTSAASYWVRVSNALGSQDSSLAAVTVINANEIPSDLALVPGSLFLMGDTTNAYPNQTTPAVTVNISDFYMGKHEVSKALWDEVRLWGIANGYIDLPIGEGKASTHPVQTLTWLDVVKWCNARSEKEGLNPCYAANGTVMREGSVIPTVNWIANGYRLPTEAEWEKAARGGVASQRFPWGNTISHANANFWNNQSESYQSGSAAYHPAYSIGALPYTSPVGSFSANGYGLFDMVGNVGEWCWDLYSDTLQNWAKDPKGSLYGPARVYRGGAWIFSATGCQNAQRFSTIDNRAYNYTGFRVARSSINEQALSPTITSNPGAVTIIRGGMTLLTVEASGEGPLSYQWYQGSDRAMSYLVGGNAASLIVAGISTTTRYWVRVSNASGSVDSSIVPVTVSRPLISGATTIVSGQSADLTVDVTSTSPLTYQWYEGSVGNTNVPVGANSANFTTPSLTSAADYWVKVSDATGYEYPLAVTVLVVNSMPGDMSLIPAGNFTLGNSIEFESNVQAVRVYVSTFYMGKHEVSKSLWDEVRTWALSNGYTNLQEGSGKAATHPVHSIDWWNMLLWCNARSEMEGLTPCYTVNGQVMRTGTSDVEVNWNANGYRLPTQAEWEKAARGGLSESRYPWGSDTIDHNHANYYAVGPNYGNLSGSAGYHPTYAIGNHPYTSPVGSFVENGYGLYDMAGNVSEWCWDGVSTSYSDGEIDPRGASFGFGRIVRGGSWIHIQTYCRCSERTSETKDDLGSSLGFRVARSSVP